jgi:hypothetical protein
MPAESTAVFEETIRDMNPDFVVRLLTAIYFKL